MPVKNTFIHFDAVAGLADLVAPGPLRRSSSDMLGGPVRRSQDRAFLCLRAASPSPEPPMTPTGSSSISSEVATGSGDSETATSVDDGAATSRGASLHATGQCKPCAWNWKPGGCRNGADCRHCHVCDQNELKRRRCERLRQLKLSRVA